MPPKRNPPAETTTSNPSDTTALQSQWTSLYRITLPTLARAKDPAQPKWPVVLDHCFARIILDNAPGIGNGATPWMETVKAPATRNMSAEQLRAAIALGEKIQGGEVDLVELDEASLRARGKESKVGEKRKREGKEEGINKEKAAAARNWSGFHGYGEGDEPKKRVKDEHTSPPQKPIPDSQEAITKALSQISSNASLTPYRKHVLSLLTQVPRGRYTTYQAIANAAARIPIPDAFHSASKSRFKSQETEVKKPAARAVGMAMRDNPYAPMVPCHRVLASDGSLGGYKGEYEKKSEGEFQREKRRILREEGVKFDGGGKAVGSVFTGFVAT